MTHSPVSKYIYELVIGGEVIRARDEDEARLLVPKVLEIILGTSKAGARHREHLARYIDVRRRDTPEPAPQATPNAGCLLGEEQ